ncbi:MAG TPA: CpsD/CapB family tyrosine-protein kinase [Candidatus Dormibacteraeota bacterium]|nr:CpsD/CapB family tyrosine-protein kinase [Candidatus Dormibacteraeota bacterium]
MSRIFDALRKSEQDRAGSASPVASAVMTAPHKAETEAQGPFVVPDQVPAIHPGAANGFPGETGDIGAETFSILHHRLELIRRRRQLQKLLVTSAVPKEGKTTVSCRLAAALARGSARVLLVDADLRHPGVHRAPGIAPLKGVADWLEHREGLPHVLRRVEPGGFFYLPAGEARSNPGELLRQPALAEFLTATAATFDWVIVDSPPLVPFVDAHHLATLVDGVLVVLRCGVTPRPALDQVFGSLERVFVAGAILNGARDKNQGYYQYYGRERGERTRAAIPPATQASTAGVSLHD